MNFENIIDIWRPPSPMIFNTGLTHIGSEGSIYRPLSKLKCITNELTKYMKTPIVKNCPENFIKNKFPGVTLEASGTWNTMILYNDVLFIKRGLSKSYRMIKKQVERTLTYVFF